MRKNPIPKSLIERARDIVLGQTVVPLSPAAFTEQGDVVLCAAACLACAGLEREDGPVAAANWADTLARRGCTEDLVEAFNYLGWDVNICREKIAFNDRMYADARQREVASMFHFWASHLEQRDLAT